jgi:hypothetical protein
MVGAMESIHLQYAAMQTAKLQAGKTQATAGTIESIHLQYAAMQTTSSQAGKIQTIQSQGTTVPRTS